MTTSTDELSPDPAVHSAHLQRQLGDLVAHLRADVARVREPQFQALLETSAEILTGLKKAFVDYSAHAEPAWRSSAPGH